MLDSIQPQHEDHPPVWQRPRRRFRFGLAIFMLLLLVGGIFAGIKVVTFAEKILEGPGNHISLRDFFIGSDRPLRGEKDDAVHLLLMGIAGSGHNGPTLTDTIILATLHLGDKPHVSLVSIPRDMVADIAGGNGYRKINSAYALGELGERHQGAAFAVQTVERIFDIEIPYYAVVDFEGFRRVLDDLGGVDIAVDQAFTDSFFPDGREGYLPPLTFASGQQHMDGTRALQYVRSRHGTNGEGSDFARSRRQQKVLAALKDKAVSFKVAANLSLLGRLMDDLADHLRTNLQTFEMRRLYDLARDIKNENIQSLAIDNAAGLLCDRIEEETGAYTLIPCQGLGQYKAIRDFVNNETADAGAAVESATIEIQNAAKIDFLGAAIRDRVQLPALTITTANFRGNTQFSESIIYDNTRGAKPNTLRYLRDRLGVSVAESPFPFATTGTLPDFVIVAASDLKDKFK